LGDATGFVKLISDKRYGEMLGAHLIGPDVAELLPELTLARFAELTTAEIARNVHAHPTLSEAIKEAAHGLEGHMLNALARRWRRPVSCAAPCDVLATGTFPRC
jgi:dihydrolipoamide dehydrogenase